MGHTISCVIEPRLVEAERPHSNLNGWKRCYNLFSDPKAERDQLALQLGFFLASWGMMRGSSFLRSFDYTIHIPVVDILLEPAVHSLRAIVPSDDTLVDNVLEVKKRIAKAYAHLEVPKRKISVTDTLSSKIMLATLGCVPAYDRFFVIGAKRKKISKSFNRRSLYELSKHIDSRREEYVQAQTLAESRIGSPVPLMRIADMYFFSIGKDGDAAGQCQSCNE